MSDPGQRARMPGRALAAGLLGGLGALPVGYVIVVWMAISAWSHGGLQWELFLLFAVPLLQIVGAARLLMRRGRGLLVTACALGSLPLLVVAPAAFQAGNGPGWWGFVASLCAPPAAFLLALGAPVRRWVDSRSTEMPVPPA